VLDAQAPAGDVGNSKVTIGCTRPFATGITVCARLEIVRGLLTDAAAYPWWNSTVKKVEERTALESQGEGRRPEHEINLMKENIILAHLPDDGLVMVSL
jgi:hypothetical protein